ncbi:MAG: mannitol dehydrogenase family protein [Rhizobiaceae bacterium]|nr:mannitol dehydrogenase family protein [Rhizobiaceae bacterium]MCV0408308.1 mannitol dehydrogenase family protein [Rhizobiaceae bacterium]
MTVTRLSREFKAPEDITTPAYDRAGAGRGIVHLGVGAFHKAHQAVYTDEALAAGGGDWMTTGVSLRSGDVAAGLNPQDGLYTLITRDGSGDSFRVVGSIGEVLVAPQDPEAVLKALTSPATRIVSLTITEKGYGLDPKSGGLDTAREDVAGDLDNPENPRTAVGFIVEALRLRRESGLGGFTALSCDNLPSNGHVLRRLVHDYARAARPGLSDWIGDHVTFPSTMVDRITPASTDRTYADVEAALGVEDLAAVETEPFTQWVVEDDFVAGRPAWEKGGAIFADDVAPYEKMKLRMLNGAHSMLAYSGFLAGRPLVRDVMADADHAKLVARHMKAAAATLDPVPGIDLGDYADDLQTRFANPAMAHQTYQIAMDGTQKLPQRLLEAAVTAVERRQPIDAFAFAVAAWMRYCLGVAEDGSSYALRDPRETEIAAVAGEAGRDPGRLAGKLTELPGLFPAALSGHAEWRNAVKERLSTMLTDGMRTAIAREAQE